MNTVPASAISVIDALTAHVALLDGDGLIVAVNEAWRRFSDDNGSRLPCYGIGSNYVEMLERLATASIDDSSGSSDDQRIAGAVAAGIRSVLAGHSPKFQMEYPCHAPWEQRWFLLTVTPFPSGSNIRIVVSHENITQLKAAEEQAREQGIRLAKSFSSMIEAIALAIEKRDPYTAGHQRQVAALATEIGRIMQLGEEQLFGLHLGATIHDIGKISIPAEILNRPGTLSQPEYAIIRCHCEIGHEILRGIEFPWPIADMVLQHHERLDGSGYPNGLKGDAICLEARIIAVADVFDAIISHRPYRPGRHLNEALRELREGRGKIYDADVIDAGLSFFADVDSEWHRRHRIFQ
ncbi:HD domain-containing protein [Dechloromonas sp. XY25]|uniref:HD domain-containing protein n=1 Tax=Dechloromonas hankyongensis TaxID=2908002 RepID=A0ABS9K1D5_9RHOO|nr:HD domain-containing phosphohydrolase [Dechloromonas hankyongensis]MCG2576968.1 HD domain-containing protein [Dechloromonas hankyongensis]